MILDIMHENLQLNRFYNEVLFVIIRLSHFSGVRGAGHRFNDRIKRVAIIDNLINKLNDITFARVRNTGCLPLFPLCNTRLPKRHSDHVLCHDDKEIHR